MTNIDAVASAIVAAVADPGADTEVGQQESLWRDVFTHLNEGLVVGEVIRDMAGTIIDWRPVEANPVWEKLSAATPPPTGGHARRMLIPGVQRDWLHAVVAVVQTGTPCALIGTVPVSGRWYEGQVFRVEGDRFAALCADVTARRAAEDEARSLTSLAAQSTDFIAVTDQDCRLRYLNPAGLHALGLTNLAAARETFLPDMFTAADREIIARTAMPATRHDGIWSGELNMQGPAAEAVIPVHFVLFPLRDRSGVLTGYGSVTRDITQRRKSEMRRAALLEVGDRLRNLEDADEMVLQAAEIMARVVGATRAGYAETDEANRAVTVLRDWTAPGTPTSAGKYAFDDYGAFLDELALGRTVAISDISADPRTVPHADRWASIGVGSVINHPIFERGKFVAVFFLHRAEPRPWTMEEIAFISNVADRTRAAVERQHAENALRTAAISLEREVGARTADRNRLWRISTELMIVAAFDGTIKAVNPAWKAQLGWNEADLVGRSMFDIVHPDDAEATRDATDRVAEGITLRRFDNRVSDKSGAFRWITWAAAPGGGMLHAVGRDFTEERTRAEAMELSEARLRSVFETTYQLQGLLALDGTLLDANPVSLSAINATLDDVVGLPFWATPWFTDTPGMPEMVAQAVPRVAKGETIRQEVVVNLPAGRRAFDFAIRPVVNAAGEVIAIVPEAMELTERRAVEEQLRQSQKMDAIGQLTGGLAHDFNNLLTAISGSLSMVKSRLAQGRPEGLERFIAAAESSAARAAALTHRLLAFARQQTLDPRPVRANVLIAGMEDLIRRTIGPQIELRTSLADGMWMTKCDPHQLESALLNLCINARDAMESGGILTLETSNTVMDAPSATARDMLAGEYVTISVSDNGTGMAPDVAARAFDPFFTTKLVGQGTGLGLSMVYGFAKQSNGQARIHSQVGVGTTVRLHLPRSPDEEDVPEPKSHEARSMSEVSDSTILVVDDEPFVAMLITDVLEELGCATIDASQAAMALDVLRSDRRVDMMITDIGLPGGMNGRQLATAARGLRPGLKILFVTGYAHAGGLDEAPLEEGMQVITKPFAIEALEKNVRDMLAS